MKRPWQIWTLFLLSLAIVVPAMCWLTLKALELDEAEARARRLAEEARWVAEFQELVGSALWRMDSTLTPLVAQEAARPYFVYQPFYAIPGEEPTKGASRQVPSPLLQTAAPYVLLHFELTPDGQWSSPQNPPAMLRQEALANGATSESIQLTATRLEELQQSISHDDLLAMLPERLLPTVTVARTQWSSPLMDGYEDTLLANDNSAVFENLRVQLDEQQNQQDGNLANAGLQQTIAPQRAAPQRAAPQRAAPAQTRTPQQAEPQPNVSRQAEQQQARQPESTPSQLSPQLFLPNQATSQAVGAAPRSQSMRAGYDWLKRNLKVQNYGQNQIVQQRLNPYLPPTVELVGEGVSRPLWVDSKLLLARRVTRGDRTLIQGCWLNWEQLKSVLMQDIADLLPQVDLVPVLPGRTVQPGRALATLPVELVVPPQVAALGALSPGAPGGGPQPLSAIRVSLVIAWSCLLVATLATAVLLRGVVTLSERRGAFVSAVTHELRTPLTTFRMYAEMLAAGMVPDAQQRQHYLETLRVEADRLSHLVENVLQYARLERGKSASRRERLELDELIRRVRSRLTDRAAQAEYRLEISVDDSLKQAELCTDPGAVEQILFNLVDNACKYATSAEDRTIHLQWQPSPRGVRVRVRDHGPGISPQDAKRLFHPFSKSANQAANSAPGVGLGLALCRRMARDLGGRLELEPPTGEGACFVLFLPAP